VPEGPMELVVDFLVADSVGSGQSEAR
jgi:hypothetical protein